jgi:TPR repeat protein
MMIAICFVALLTMARSSIAASQRVLPRDEQNRSTTLSVEDRVDIEKIRSSYYGFDEIPPGQQTALQRIAQSDDAPGEILFYAGILESTNEKRMKLFERALAEGYGPAKTGIAHQILTGDDVTQRDRSRAVQLLEEAIAADDPAASSFLGLVYADGIAGIKRDPARAQGLLNQAVERGFVKHAYRLATLSNELGDPRRAEEALEFAAEAGDVRAMTDRGIELVLLNEQAPAAQRGVRLLEDAAAKNYPPAMAALGRTLANRSDASEAEQARAKELTRKAALAGEPNAGVFLAEIYLLGLLEQDADPFTGTAILEKLSAENVSQADYILGIILQEGRYGQQVDHERARMLLEKSAAAGNSDAVRILRKLEGGEGRSLR